MRHTCFLSTASMRQPMPRWQWLKGPWTTMVNGWNGWEHVRIWNCIRLQAGSQHRGIPIQGNLHMFAKFCDVFPSEERDFLLWCHTAPGCCNGVGCCIAASYAWRITITIQLGRTSLAGWFDDDRLSTVEHQNINFDEIFTSRYSRALLEGLKSVGFWITSESAWNIVGVSLERGWQYEETSSPSPQQSSWCTSRGSHRINPPIGINTYQSGLCAARRFGDPLGLILMADSFGKMWNSDNHGETGPISWTWHMDFYGSVVK